MNNFQLNLTGYWKIDFAPERSSESYGEIYLRFTENGLLQWGYENQLRTFVSTFDYWLENEKIITICPPNPRKKSTPFSFTSDEKLKLFYSNYETIWARADKQDFFESYVPEVSGYKDFRQLDYMSELEMPPSEFQIKTAASINVSPDIIRNTHALWHAWQYSLGEFASFHADEFKMILNCGVLAEKTCQQKLTLLMYIVSDGYIEVIDTMLEAGFDINADDISGNTPLDYAVFGKQPAVFQFLRERSAKLGNELKSFRWLRRHEQKLKMTEKTLQNIYDAFNKRDIEIVLATMADDVKWANGWEGGFVYGRDNVREYWRRQFEVIKPQLEILETEIKDNQSVVKLRQIATDLDGNVLDDKLVEHVFTFEDGLITVFEIN